MSQAQNYPNTFQKKCVFIQTLNILVLFKKLQLNGHSFSWFVFWYAHGNKTTPLFPPHRLIDTFIIFNPVCLSTLVPLRSIKGWLASLIAKNELISFFNCCLLTLPTDEPEYVNRN
ncbi:MAG: hypothetical protein AYP45_11140 [Candidatus Brocadia carolinensis]|uniref:Uncharacterized protein n=1 Tax=Candidatus Brocadia carolinensis TaxID=1004156 RepID=A0A1V4ASP0_9BACT|nr:MAG: hypothetical protein AYP45_11140 [Candidatus Brocadia caroliniensis]